MESPAEMIDRALALHRAGDITGAEAIYQGVLAIDPRSASALHLLGVARSQQGRKDQAVELISKAIEINPNVADFYVNLGLVYIELGNPIKALPYCQRAIQLAPNHADAYNHMGLALGQLSRIEQAILYLRKAMELRENHVDAMINLAAIYQRLGRFEDALVMLNRLQRARGPRATTFAQMGDMLRELKRAAEAEAAYKQAVALDPKFAEGYSGLALLLHERKDLATSVPYYEKALALNPGSVSVLSNFGLALSGIGQLDRAFDAYHKALAIRPDFANALNNLANAYRERLELDKTMETYNRTLFFQPDHPDARWNRSLLQLLLGNFDEGWREYEWRWLKFPQERRPFTQTRWDGFDISGKSILLFAEQGFGDAIQFARYIPMVAERGARVVLECQPELTDLLKTVGGVEEVHARGETVPPTDFQCPLMSLGGIFRTRLDNIPAKVPYLHADPQRVAAWKQKLAPYANKFKVGISWAGSKRHHRDLERSMRLKDFVPLKQIEGVKWYNLQKGPPADDPARADFPLVDYTNEIDSFADSAALVENLDLVICVDTAIAHLAGALARPVWTLVPYLPDWRWLMDREDSPWYPTMQLFRQLRISGWDKVVERLASSLRKNVTAKNKMR